MRNEPVEHSKHEIRNTIIIALTASPFEQERAIALKAGSDDFLVKPFRQAQIFDLLQRHLGVRYVYEEGERIEAKDDNSPLEGDTPHSPLDGGLKEMLSPSGSGQGWVETLTPESLAALPSKLLNALEEALLRSRVEEIDQVIQDIRAQNGALADALAHLAGNFAYGEMLKLVREAKEATTTD